MAMLSHMLIGVTMPFHAPPPPPIRQSLPQPPPPPLPQPIGDPEPSSISRAQIQSPDYEELQPSQDCVFTYTDDEMAKIGADFHDERIKQGLILSPQHPGVEFEVDAMMDG
jgi:hypothetical protein